MENNPKWGDVYLVEIPNMGGSVACGLGPCVITSNNKRNLFSPTVKIIPISSQIRKKSPVHVPIHKKENSFLKTESIAVCEDEMPIDKSCLIKRLGELDSNTMSGIMKALVLDGQQRLNAIAGFIMGKYQLVKTSPIVKIDNSYFLYDVENPEHEKLEVINFEKVTFDELPEDVQEIINSYMIRVNYFENISDLEVRELFIRLNGGKQLTATELNRVHISELDTILELSNHSLFDEILTASSFNSRTNENITIRTISVLNGYYALDTKSIRAFISKAIISEKEKTVINEVFDKFKAIYLELKSDKHTKKISTKIKKPTNLISLITLLAQEDDTAKILEWIKYFFNSNETTVNSQYNSMVLAGSAQEVNVKTRTNIVLEDYNNFKNSN